MQRGDKHYLFFYAYCPQIPNKDFFQLFIETAQFYGNKKIRTFQPRFVLHAGVGLSVYHVYIFHYFPSCVQY